SLLEERGTPALTGTSHAHAQVPTSTTESVIFPRSARLATHPVAEPLHDRTHQGSADPAESHPILPMLPHPGSRLETCETLLPLGTPLAERLPLTLVQGFESTATPPLLPLPLLLFLFATEECGEKDPGSE